MILKRIKKINQSIQKFKDFIKRSNYKFKFDLWRFVLFGSLLSLLFIIYTFARLSIELPDYKKLSEYRPSIISRFYAGDGTLLVEYAEENRIFVEYEELPANLINAFLSAEDRKFWSHSGIDFIGIVRASIMNFISLFTGGSFQGASTITQQVAKNFFLTPERSISRKIKEAILALKIERAFTKRHILVLYFNQIYLGAKSFGVAAAAQAYFNKSLKELTLSECAFLAALPKAPNNYNPVTKTERAINRRNWVLQRMLKQGYITQAQYIVAKGENLQVSTTLSNASENANLYFTEEVRRELEEKYGNEQLYRSGFSVRTTADSNFQKYAMAALRNTILNYDRRTGWKGADANYDFDNLSWIDEELAETRDKINDTIVSNKIYKNKIDRLLKLKQELTDNYENLPAWYFVLMYDDLISGMEKNGWKKAIVLSVGLSEALIGLKDKTTGVIKLRSSLWARATNQKTMTVGSIPNSMRDILNKGDIIFVSSSSKSSNEFELKQSPKLEGALVAMDPHTGRVLAAVGGFSYYKSKFNRVTQAKRQPGSTIKPFIYLAGLENGYEPNSVLLDAPLVATKEDGNLWKPDNFDYKFLGNMTFRNALQRSRNGPAVRLANSIGIGTAIKTAEKFGVYHDVKTSDINLSMALGSGDTTLLDLTTAYASIINGGKKITPRFIDRIQDRDGKTIYNLDTRICQKCNIKEEDINTDILLNPPKIEDSREQLASPQSIYQLISIMEGVVKNGTGTMARIPGKTIAGKTGTTNDNKDGWFVGGTTDLVVGVWFGYDTPQNMGEYYNGATLSAPTFEAFTSKALRGYRDKSFPVPNGLKFLRVNKQTGKLASSDDKQKDIILEVLKSNTANVSNDIDNKQPNRKKLSVDLDGIY